MVPVSILRRIATVLVVAAGLSGITYWGYKELRLQRHLHLAHQYAESGDSVQSAFFAKLVLQADPENDKAMKTLGLLGEKEGYPWQSIQWQGRRAELRPREAEVLMDFARALILGGQSLPAEKVLHLASALPEVNARRLGGLQAQAAMAKGDAAAAIRIHRMLLKNYPYDSLITYNLANMLALSTDSASRTEGKRLLLALWDGKEHLLQVSRSLAALALEDKDALHLHTWLGVLQEHPDATLSDHLLAGDVMRILAGGLTESWRRHLADKAATSVEVYRVLSWFRKRGLAAEGLEWTQLLSPVRQQLPGTFLGRAECLADLDQWVRLQGELINQDWVSLEHFRFAFLLEGQLRNGPVASNATNVLQGAPLKILARSLAIKSLDYYRLMDLLTHWKWPPETRDTILSSVAAGSRTDKVQIMALIQEAQQRRDTKALFHFGKRLLLLDPGNRLARHNVAVYGLLLAEDVQYSTKLARELFEEQPDVMTSRLTWAYAHAMDGYAQQALEIVHPLNPETDLSQQDALYYGLILERAGKKEEARFHFLRARLNNKWLPEEEKLLHDALAGLYPIKVK